MISDALLREAAAEAEVCLLANLPEVQPHEFSAGFERKMKRLISRANHPIRHQVLRYAAAVLLAVLTLFGAVMAVSPEARAAVVGWVRSTYNKFVGYSFIGADVKETEAYQMTYILDGYRLSAVIDKENKQIYLYTDDLGRGITFVCYYPYGDAKAEFFAAVGDYQEYSGFVHGVEAEIYLANLENESNAIVWRDEDTGVLLQVHAFADIETLIKLAEGVKKE